MAGLKIFKPDWDKGTLGLKLGGGGGKADPIADGVARFANPGIAERDLSRSAADCAAGFGICGAGGGLGVLLADANPAALRASIRLCA